MLLESLFFIVSIIFLSILLVPFKLLALLRDGLTQFLITLPLQEKGLQPLVASNRNKLNFAVVWCTSIFGRVQLFLNIPCS